MALTRGCQATATDALSVVRPTAVVAKKPFKRQMSVDSRRDYLNGSFVSMCLCAVWRREALHRHGGCLDQDFEGGRQSRILQGCTVERAARCRRSSGKSRSRPFLLIYIYILFCWVVRNSALSWNRAASKTCCWSTPTLLYLSWFESFEGRAMCKRT